jgi:DNA repair protein RecO (recombination protein O)
MPKTWSDEAIVLRTYNVGDTDRFCILLTERNGRIAARANGVRRLKSRRGAGLMPLHRIHLTYELRSAGYNITAAACLDPHTSSWRDPHVFSCAQQGIELILKLTEEGEPLPEVYALTCTFLRACRAPHPRHLVPFFSLKLLNLLGLLPSATHSAVSHLPFKPGERLVVGRSGGLSLLSEELGGSRISPELGVLLTQIPKVDLGEPSSCPKSLLADLERFVQGLLGSQLGVELKSPEVSLALSSGVTPT